MHRLTRILLPCGFAAAALLSAASAQAQEQPNGDFVAALSGCKAIVNAAARLDCYDRTTVALEQAVSQKRVVVMDRESLRKTRRSLFGLSLPSLPFLSDSDDAPEQREISSKIKAVRSSGYGKWQVTLEDGAVWQTTEPSRAGNEPDPGEAVTIRRGPLGSYTMNVAGGRGVKAVRENSK